MIDYIEKEFSTAKQRFKKYFSMEHSLGNMMEIAKSFFFVVSIGINEINDGIKNPKGIQVMILHIFYLGIFTLILNIFISNYLYSLLK